MEFGKILNKKVTAGALAVLSLTCLPGCGARQKPDSSRTGDVAMTIRIPDEILNADRLYEIAREVREKKQSAKGLYGISVGASEKNHIDNTFIRPLRRRDGSPANELAICRANEKVIVTYTHGDLLENTEKGSEIGYYNLTGEIIYTNGDAVFQVSKREACGPINAEELASMAGIDDDR